ncbi:MAG: ABC transporter permease subunit [Hyphomicrobium sp.]|uniref:ABC transporter permease n=1 Tax=Hyphomicrobium sp. TaxID=82 RepID=UPI0039E31166
MTSDRPALSLEQRFGIAAAIVVVLACISWLLPVTAKYPLSWKWPLDQLLTVWLKFLVSEISFITRGIARILEAPFDLAVGLLAKGFEIPLGSRSIVIPPLSWAGICATFVWIGYRVGGIRLGLLQAVGCAYLVFFGQWEAAMTTLASVLVCVPVAVACGLLIGVLGYSRPKLNQWLLWPGLDIMQTVPAFAYLIPTLLLFGFGPVAAMIATVIFAMPPMARVTALALNQTPMEIRELGKMVGCTERQIIWRILLPSSLPTLLVGLNQTVMMTLNMVIVASMIGAGGLGFDVLRALRQLDIDKGFESGAAIVVLAVMLDRQGIALANAAKPTAATSKTLAAAFAVPAVLLLGMTLLGTQFDWLREFPSAFRLSTGGALNAAMEWINVNYFDTMEAFRIFVLTHLMNPIKIALTSAPWLLVSGSVTLLAFGIGGARMALLSAFVFAFCLVTGLWEKAMITIYLCLSATVVSVLIGVPIAILAARSDSLYRATTVGIEVLQTLPSFVYLIPVVMLFRVGDFAALLAIVAFAITPVIKFTMTALRSVPPDLIEAGRSMGCSGAQLDLHIRFPVALPSILLGINQALLFSLAMVVITALVGTRDLGQEVYIALTAANPGRGLVAGLCLALLGILIDRLFQTGVARLQHRKSADSFGQIQPAAA